MQHPANIILKALLMDLEVKIPFKGRTALDTFRWFHKGDTIPWGADEAEIMQDGIFLKAMKSIAGSTEPPYETWLQLDYTLADFVTWANSVDEQYLSVICGDIAFQESKRSR